MTLIVCAKAIDGMVLASDSRGTFGDPQNLTAQNDTMKKVVKLNENAVLLASGSAEIGETIIQEIVNDLKQANIKSVTEVMEFSRKKFKQRYDEWFLKYPPLPHPQNPAFVRPVLGIIIGGYDLDHNNKYTIPKIYSLLSVYDFAPMLHNYGFGLQGVPQYALYLMNRLYSPEMNTEQLKHLLAYIITETATQDAKVGGPVQIAIIQSEKCKELSREEAESIINKNISNSNRLKELFFQRDTNGQR
ncbi:hypothetical protein HYY69_03245 [Candidatus Woesearchaeota archaeon]|nr:hypothetical protein [Candidatus Woesearchaeota archaeon]